MHNYIRPQQMQMPPAAAHIPVYVAQTGAGGAPTSGTPVDRRHAVHNAFIQLVVNCVGVFVVGIFYLNYFVLEAYFLALFWATVASIPMFEVKKYLTGVILNYFLGEELAEAGIGLEEVEEVMLGGGAGGDPGYVMTAEDEQQETGDVGRQLVGEDCILGTNGGNGNYTPTRRVSYNAAATVSMSGVFSRSSATATAAPRNDASAVKRRLQMKSGDVEEQVEEDSYEMIGDLPPMNFHGAVSPAAPHGSSAATSARTTSQSPTSRSRGGTENRSNRGGRYFNFFSRLFGTDTVRWWSRYESYSGFLFRDVPFLLDVLSALLHFFLVQPLKNFFYERFATESIAWPWFALLYRAVFFRGLYRMYKLDPDLFDPLGETASSFYVLLVSLYILLVAIRLIDGVLWHFRRSTSYSGGNSSEDDPGTTSRSTPGSSTASSLLERATRLSARRSSSRELDHFSPSTQHRLLHETSFIVQKSVLRGEGNRTNSQHRLLHETSFLKGNRTNSHGGGGGVSVSSSSPLSPSLSGGGVSIFLGNRLSGSRLLNKYYQLRSHSVGRGAGGGGESRDTLQSGSSVPGSGPGSSTTGGGAGGTTPRFSAPATLGGSSSSRGLFPPMLEGRGGGMLPMASPLSSASEVMASAGPTPRSSEEVMLTPMAGSGTSLAEQGNDDGESDEEDSATEDPSALKNGVQVDGDQVGEGRPQGKGRETILSEDVDDDVADHEVAHLDTFSKSLSDSRTRDHLLHAADVDRDVDTQTQSSRGSAQLEAVTPASASKGTSDVASAEETAGTSSGANNKNSTSSTTSTTTEAAAKNSDEGTTTTASSPTTEGPQAAKRKPAPTPLLRRIFEPITSFIGSILECIVEISREVYYNVLALILTDQIHTILAIFIIVFSAFLCAVFLVLCASELARETAFLWTAAQGYAQQNELFQQRVLPLLTGLGQAMHVLKKSDLGAVSGSPSPPPPSGKGISSTTSAAAATSGASGPSGAGGSAAAASSLEGASAAAAPTGAGKVTGGSAAPGRTATFTVVAGRAAAAGRAPGGQNHVDLSAGANANLTQYYNELFSGFFERNLVEYEFLKLVYDAYTEPTTTGASSEKGITGAQEQRVASSEDISITPVAVSPFHPLVPPLSPVLVAQNGITPTPPVLVEGDGEQRTKSWGGGLDDGAVEVAAKAKSLVRLLADDEHELRRPPKCLIDGKGSEVDCGNDRISTSSDEELKMKKEPLDGVVPHSAQKTRGRQADEALLLDEAGGQVHRGKDAAGKEKDEKASPASDEVARKGSGKTTAKGKGRRGDEKGAATPPDERSQETTQGASSKTQDATEKETKVLAESSGGGSEQARGDKLGTRPTKTNGVETLTDRDGNIGNKTPSGTISGTAKNDLNATSAPKYDFRISPPPMTGYYYDHNSALAARDERSNSPKVDIEDVLRADSSRDFEDDHEIRDRTAEEEQDAEDADDDGEDAGASAWAWLASWTGTSSEDESRKIPGEVDAEESSTRGSRRPERKKKRRGSASVGGEEELSEQQKGGAAEDRAGSHKGKNATLLPNFRGIKQRIFPKNGTATATNGTDHANTTSQHHRDHLHNKFSLRDLKQARAFLFEIFRGNFTQARGLGSEAFDEVYQAYQNNRLTFTLNSFTETLQSGFLSTSSDPATAAQQRNPSPVTRFLAFVALLLRHWLSTFLEVIFQGIVFMTALFYMLKSRVSVMHYVDEFLAVIDSSRMVYQCVERVLRAILYSAVKMCVFYTLYTWFVCSFFNLPLVFFPTVLAGVMALVPVVDPIYIAFVANFYVYWYQSGTDATICSIINATVWWNVTVAIYCEIPDSNPWLTGLGVVLGISHFGVKGVVLGPVLVVIPLLCYELLFVFNATVAEASGAQQGSGGGKPTLVSPTTSMGANPNSSVVGGGGGGDRDSVGGMTLAERKAAGTSTTAARVGPRRFSVDEFSSPSPKLVRGQARYASPPRIVVQKSLDGAATGLQLEGGSTASHHPGGSLVFSMQASASGVSAAGASILGSADQQVVRRRVAGGPHAASHGQGAKKQSKNGSAPATAALPPTRESAAGAANDGGSSAIVEHDENEGASSSATVDDPEQDLSVSMSRSPLVGRDLGFS